MLINKLLICIELLDSNVADTLYVWCSHNLYKSQMFGKCNLREVDMLVTKCSASVCPTDNKHLEGDDLIPILEYKSSSHQKMAGYFRTWEDVAGDTTGTARVSYGDLPDCIDMAIAFGNDNPDFWPVFKNKYIPFMHERGTKCITCINVNKLVDSEYTNDEAGYKELASKIATEKVFDYGADGIDVDVESDFSGEGLERVIGVFSALADIMHDAGLTITYDTNKTGAHPLFVAVYSKVDYVFVQSYGRSVSGLQTTFDSFKAYIKPEQYFIGFSFYEENGTDWGDVQEPLEESRAYSYAMWQPSEGTKGGIFSYAIDRDGVAAGDDTIQSTNYPVTRTLIATMNP